MDGLITFEEACKIVREDPDHFWFMVWSRDDVREAFVRHGIENPSPELVEECFRECQNWEECLNEDAGEYLHDTVRDMLKAKKKEK